MHSPGFAKPTHVYGIELTSPEVSALDPLAAEAFDEALAEVPYDENWAGQGFEQRYEEK